MLRCGLKQNKEQQNGSGDFIALERTLSKIEKNMNRGSNLLNEMVKRQKVNQISERIFMDLVVSPSDAPRRGLLWDRLTELAGVEGNEVNDTGPVGSSGNAGEESNGGCIVRDEGSEED